MTGDNATPTPPDPEGHHHLGKTLTGWEEIRQALEFVEEFPDFLKEYEKYRSTNPELVEAFVRRIVENNLQTSQSETQRYVSELLDYLRDDFSPEVNLDERI